MERDFSLYGEAISGIQLKTTDTLMATTLQQTGVDRKRMPLYNPFFKSSPIAQLVEQMTVNHWVRGSSPRRGATSTLTSLHLR